jgi:uncharacterized membrane protein (DUF485 family)
MIRRDSTDETACQMMESPAFRALVTRRRRVSLLLTLVLFAIYGTYIGFVAYGRDFLSGRSSYFGGGATVGVSLALGVIVLLWAIITLYVVWANGPYDREVRRVRNQPRL